MEVLRRLIDVPHGSRTALVKIRYRGKITGKLNTGNRNWPNFILSFHDESGYFIGDIYWSPHNLELQTSFVTFERVSTIPKGAITATFSFNNGNCNGVFDFTRASAMFH